MPAHETRYVGRERGSTASWVWGHEPWDLVFAVIVGDRPGWVIHHEPEILDEIRQDAVFMDTGTPELLSRLHTPDGLQAPPSPVSHRRPD